MEQKLRRSFKKTVRYTFKTKYGTKYISVSKLNISKLFSIKLVPNRKIMNIF